MPKLDREAALRFLLARARTAKLATVRADGRPHIAPVWFDLDGETLIFTTWHTTIKAVNIARDSRVSICVDDDMPPFTFVQLEGTAELIDDQTELAHWAKRIAGRYMGADQAEAYGNRNSVPGELLVRVTPTRIVGQSNVAGWE